MTAHGLRFRQDFAAPLPVATLAPPETALEQLQTRLIEQQRDDGHWTDEWASVATTIGPVGVTARAVIALVESGMSPAVPAIVQAVDWLWGRTVAPAAKDPDPPEAESLSALLAFLRTGRVAPDSSNAVVRNAVQALRELQDDDGGWILDGNDNDAETTGEVLNVLGLSGFTVADAVVRAALAFLDRKQEPDSGWGDAGATSAVLTGLHSVGVDNRWLSVGRATSWIKRTQRADTASIREAANAIRALLLTDKRAEHG
jgi:hypothetical protein